MAPDLDDLRRRIAELRAWADGYEEVNETAARRLRSFLDDVGELVDAYRGEASGRRAMQANYQRCLVVIGSRIYDQAVRAQIAAEIERDVNPLL